MKKYFLMAVAVLLLAGQNHESRAQISQGGTPRSLLKVFTHGPIPVATLGEVEVDKLRIEDAERRAMGKEFDRRFGYTFDVQLNTENAGVWTLLPNGDRIWQLKISNPGALSINLTFSTYDLPEGADLFIFGAKNKIGALTRFNNQQDKKLGTGLISGDWAVLEYFEPAQVRGLGKLEIGKATHGYKDPYSTLGWGQSASCEMNVNCPLGAAWKDEKRSVGRIIDNGDVCTGTLLNNVLQDGKPYFLTADHCYAASSTTWVFSFNWEAQGCTTPTTAIPENQTVSGSTLKARNTTSDFCLLLLNNKPPESFNVYYSGWSAQDVPSTASTIIHHPAGDIKKITFDLQPVASTSYYNNQPNNNSHWQTGNYEYNTTTEGGSSGSAIFDQNHRVVGQLHGGPASCTNFSEDYYGKVSASWLGGGTASTRLKDWLDPLNTGLLTLDGLDPACLRISVKLPWNPELDNVVQALPNLWKVKNPNADSTFRLVTGGYNTINGKAFRINAENFNPAGRKDTLILSPIAVDRYKKIKISFRHAYRAKIAQPTDQITLMVSRDCGSTFRNLNQWTGSSLVTDPTTGSTSAFSPTDTAQWIKNVLNLDSSYNKSGQLVFAFSFTSGNAGTLWLDEFLVTGDTVKNKPLAQFESNRKDGCAGVQIQFSDSSLFNPSSWNWIFAGGTPSTSNLQNPIVTYNNEGNYPVKLVVTNEEGSDTLEKTSFIVVQNLGSEVTPFLQSFGTANVFPPVGYILNNPDNNVTWVRNATINAPGSTGGSLMFDNYSNPNVSGQKDLLLFPKISSAGKNHLKLRLKYAYKNYAVAGVSSPDTLTIGYKAGCDGLFTPLWKKGGADLATAGSLTTSFSPIATDWKTIGLNLDSLLQNPEVAIGFENRFGFGNRLFLDEIYIDTVDNCPSAPTVTANNDTLCSGTTLTLTADSVAGGTYSWTGPNQFSSTSRVATRVTANSSAGTYLGSVTVNGCTSPSSSLSITVLASPGVPNIGQTGNVLTGPANMINYLWILGSDTLPENTRSITATISGSYVLVVFNVTGCSRRSNPRNVVVTSNQTILEKNGILAYPNPTNAKIQVVSDGQKIEFEALFNSIGKRMEVPFNTNPNGGVELDLHLLPEGNYWLRVKSKYETTTFHVSKK